MNLYQMLSIQYGLQLKKMVLKEILQIPYVVTHQDVVSCLPSNFQYSRRQSVLYINGYNQASCFLIGPQNLQVDALERSVRVYWDEAIVPAETESLTYRIRLQNANIRPIVGEVLSTPDAKYEYACYFRDLWTDTQYTLVITTVIDEGDWDPPTEQEIKTRRGKYIFNFFIWI